MDYIRSCYSTKVQFTPGGPLHNIDWFFVPARNPKMPKHAFGSLNWLKPDYPTDQLGEVVGVPRPWRDGSRPDYINRNNATFSTMGLSDWFVDGAPADFGQVQPLTWYGSRAFPGPFDVGIFPPLNPTTAVPTLLTPGGTPAPGTWNGSAWHFSSFAGSPGVHAVDVYWGHPPGPWIPVDNMFHCFPDLAVLWAQDIFHGTLMQCTHYATPTSTWVDPTGVVYAPGTVLTLTGI